MTFWDQFYKYVFSSDVANVLEFLGAISLSISGIRLASAKQIDLFGALVVGSVTALGGGTTRDLLLGITPFWMRSYIFILGTFIGFVIVIFFRHYVIRIKNTMFWFDSIGLGLYVVVGYEKSMQAGYPFWVSILMGTITGVVGGAIRDTLINEIPLIFKHELYAVVCLIGGLYFSFLYYCLHINTTFCEVSTAILIMAIRILAVKRHWTLPILKGDNHE